MRPACPATGSVVISKVTFYLNPPPGGFISARAKVGREHLTCQSRAKARREITAERLKIALRPLATWEGGPCAPPLFFWREMNQCYLCESTEVETHHIYTRGAWGIDALVPENEIPLCRWKHHPEVHTIGRDTWAQKYGLEDRVKEAYRAVARSKISRK